MIFMTQPFWLAQNLANTDARGDPIIQSDRVIGSEQASDTLSGVTNGNR